jgi:thioredoxin 1
VPLAVKRGSATAIAIVALATGAGMACFAWVGREPEPLPHGTLVDDDVQRALSKGKPTVVEFGANACATCREMKPVLAQLAQLHADRIVVVDIDIRRQRDYASRYAIHVMPTQVFFDAAGREVSRNTGKIGLADMSRRLGVAR